MDSIEKTNIVMGIFAQIAEEMGNQDMKWGVQEHLPDRWMSILIEEIGEAAKEINEVNRNNYRDELIQTAAVIIQMIAGLDRSNWGCKYYEIYSLITNEVIGVTMNPESVRKEKSRYIFRPISKEKFDNFRQWTIQ